MVMNSSMRSSLISASTITEKGLSDILRRVLLVKDLVYVDNVVLVASDVALLLLNALDDRSKMRQEAESSFMLSLIVGEICGVLQWSLGQANE
jgi:hypothetical protein